MTDPSDKDPSRSDPITHVVITAINNMLTNLMTAMSHKDGLNCRQRQKQGIERAHTLRKYRIMGDIRKLCTTDRYKTQHSGNSRYNGLRRALKAVAHSEHTA